MDALVRLRDDSLHAEQRRALGGPVAGRPGAVLLAGQDDERNAVLLVVHGGVVDRRLRRLAPTRRAEVAGEAALDAGHQLVAEPDVRERAADHDLVVAPA